MKRTSHCLPLPEQRLAECDTCDPAFEFRDEGDEEVAAVGLAKLTRRGYRNFVVSEFDILLRPS
jgi:hypothetical protein